MEGPAPPGAAGRPPGSAEDELREERRHGLRAKREAECNNPGCPRGGAVAAGELMWPWPRFESWMTCMQGAGKEPSGHAYMHVQCAAER